MVVFNVVEPPAGYTPIAVRRDGRERKVDLSFRGPGGVATLVLLPVVDPPRGSPTGRWAGPRCQLGLVGRGDALLRWAGERLGLAPVPVSDSREARLARLLRSVRKLKARRRFGAWQLRRLTSQPGDSVRLELAGPQAWQVALSLSMSPDAELAVVTAERVPEQELQSLLQVVKAAA